MKKYKQNDFSLGDVVYHKSNTSQKLLIDKIIDNEKIWCKWIDLKGFCFEQINPEYLLTVEDRDEVMELLGS